MLAATRGAFDATRCFMGLLRPVVRQVPCHVPGEFHHGGPGWSIIQSIDRSLNGIRAGSTVHVT